MAIAVNKNKISLFGTHQRLVNQCFLENFGDNL